MADHAPLDDELERLRAENAHLRRLAALHEASAAAQGMRAGARAWDASMARLQVLAMQRSLFWRVTAPLRIAIDLARGAPKTGSKGAYRLRRVASMAARDGIRPTFAAVRRQLRAERQQKQAISAPSVGAAGPALPPPHAVLAPCVLIVAELSVPQCAKYRVWQKQEMILSLGAHCRVVDWRQPYDCFSAASVATQAILYRVPAEKSVLQLIELLRSLGVPVRWEVDDLIFDVDLYGRNSNLRTLEPALKRDLMRGAQLYRDGLLTAGRGIASTPRLADAMRAAGIDDVVVVENALDAETLALAHEIRASRDAHAGLVITYGSGTRTHDADFLEAAPALLQLMEERPDVRLRIVGDLGLPDAFGAVAARVERVGKVPYAEYLRLLGDSDISLAPLEASAFNDAKSNIKFLEAAILGVPSIVSPRAEFVRVVEHGINGMLADGEGDWLAALRDLADDAGLRYRMGEAALGTALSRYAPDAVARTQIAPLLAETPDARVRPALRTLIANVFFPPKSYGGATIVAEEMARRLAAMPGTEVSVVTTLDADKGEGLSLRRRGWNGIQVFDVPVSTGDPVAEFDNPAASRMFADILDAVQPDIVHFHSVQGLGAGLAVACRARGIPYVMTLHDVWWLCPRQFMVRLDGHYCAQRKIDLRVCQACVPEALHLKERQALLMEVLRGAARLISPSRAHREVYLAQGFDPDHIVVAPNGVRKPQAPVVRRRAEHIRFGYVGGVEIVKGYPLVKRTFEALDRGGWDLTLVDNTLNLGFTSIDASDWNVQGRVRIIPAYRQDEIDSIMAEFDVLLFPSQWKESFGLTVREALLRDVWVIATEGGGAAEAMTDGVNGTLIRMDGTHDGLLDAVRAVLDGGLPKDYRNPLGGSIMGYDEQADDLYRMLTGIVEHAA